MISQHTFRRNNGQTFTIELVIDVDKVARHMAERLARNGATKAKIASGAVMAVIKE